MWLVDNQTVETKINPVIAIVGRPNVGKSTLFNRILGRKRALVHNLPGVTRDRLEEKAVWHFQKKKVKVSILDTGGVGEGTFAQEIESQVAAALQSADAAVIVFDAQTGPTVEDREVVEKFRRSGLLKRIPVFCALNKTDSERQLDDLSEFYELGFDSFIPVSAEHNRGVETLMDEVLERLNIEGKLDSAYVTEAELQEEERIPRVAIVGKPNVGKSTLTNAMLGEERMIVSNIAGTTVDSIDSKITVGDHQFILIDTAGVRRKSKTEQGVEVLSVLQTKKALERADVALLVVDGEVGPTDQDEKIGSLIDEVGCSVVIVVNKWDLIDQRFKPEMAAEHIRSKMGYLKWAPILLTSAKKRRGFEDLPELIDDILTKRRRRISTSELTEWVQANTIAHNPFDAKFYMMSQVSTNPPTFLCRVNDPGKVHFSLERYLINQMRETYGFDGSPVRIKFKN